MPTRSNLGSKDYELIAAVLAESNLAPGDLDDLAFTFADRLVATSDSFDPTRFIKAATDVDFEPAVLKAHSTALRLRVEALEARRSPR